MSALSATPRSVVPAILGVILIASACNSSTSTTATAPSLPPATSTSVAAPQAPAATIAPSSTTSTPTTSITLPEVVADPPSGQWLRTNPDLGGLIVDTRDMIWDGENFYLLTRIGFGDVIVWESPDGVEWTEHSQIGTAGTVDGPFELTSTSGRLIAAGRRGTTATVWVDEGEQGWAEVEVGPGTIDHLVFFMGNYLALGRASAFPEPGQSRSDNNPLSWRSWDGYTWTETVGAEFFESVAWTAGLVVGPAGLLTVAVADTDHNPVSAVVTSTNGIDWVFHQPTDLDTLMQVDSITGTETGYAAYGLLADSTEAPSPYSPILWSPDGINWEALGSPDGSDSEWIWPGWLGTFGDYIVLSGQINIGDESHPRVWAYRGDGLWTVLGTGDWYNEPGAASAMVSGNGRLIVRAQIGGPATDPWSIFTFVPDTSD